MKIILVSISMAVIAAYVVAACIRKGGIPASISSTFYVLKSPWWFTLCMYATALPLLPVLLGASDDVVQPMAFLAAAGMLLIGAAPHFREDFEHKIHTAGAATCLAFSQLWVMFMSPWFLLAWALWIAYTAISMVRWWNGRFKDSFLLTKPLFWVEIVALGTTYAALLCNL